MDDLTEIRKENLRKLGMTAAQLADLGIGGYSYWAPILQIGGKKSFAERKVRELEEKLNLPDYSMDRRGADMSERKKTWLLPRVDIARYILLSEEGKAAAQAAFRKAIEDEIEAEARLNKPNGSTGHR
jgi:hypothetical protein